MQVRQKKKKFNTRIILIGYAFILPALGFNLLFDWYPMLDGVVMSFFRWDGFRTATFVGLRNFVQIFQDDVFWTSVKNMMFFFVAGIILMAPAIISSVVLFRMRNKRLQYFYRVLLCIPMVIPFMVIILIWQFMYNPQYGFFNQLLTSLGFVDYLQTWLGDPKLAKWCILFVGFPWVSTNSVLIYLGGLQSVDNAIWEAASIDGVTSLKRFFYMELPLIRGQFKLNLIGALVGGVTGYTMQMVMTKGGPGFETLVPGLYMYNKAFTAKQYGYAAAVGLVLFAVSLILTLLTLKLVRSDDQ